MKKFAIWKDHKVIGYCMMDEETRQKLNALRDASIYIGYDPETKPEMYKKEVQNYV